jgi:hypothetical protein
VSDVRHELELLAAGIDWPQTPDLAGAVAARVRETPQRRPLLPALPIAVQRLQPALGVLLAVLVTVAAVPPARSSVLEFLGLEGGEKVVRRSERPVAPRQEPELGREVTLTQARRAVAFRIRLPRGLGPPTAVHLQLDRIPGGAVSLSYGGGTVLTEFEGRGIPYAQKALGPDARVARVEVRDAAGLFLTGGDRSYVALDRSGHVIEGTARIVDAAVLLWDRDGIAFRLETRLGRDRALALARSVR